MTVLRWISSFSLVLATAVAGMACQFLFPTPIDREGLNLSTEAPKTVRSVGRPFAVGEVITADIFLDDILSGRGEIRAPSVCPIDGRPAIYVETTAETVGVAKLLEDVRSETRSAIELDTGLPLVSFSALDSGDKRATYDTVFGPGQFAYRQVRSGGSKPPKTLHRTLKLPIEQSPHDLHSTLGYLRNWRPRPGTTGFLYATYGRSPWHVEVNFVGPEILQVATGERAAIRIEGSATRLVGKALKPSESQSPRSFVIWFSDDDDKAPLRILVESTLAKLTVELTSRTISRANQQLCSRIPNKASLTNGAAGADGEEDKEEKNPLERLIRRP